MPRNKNCQKRRTPLKAGAISNDAKAARTHSMVTYFNKRNGPQVAALVALQETVIPDFEIVTLPPDSGGIPKEVWKIAATIPQLAYLTHNFFRYYGKFPSVLARTLIARYSEPGNTVLDNMAGCGTTLVEALLLGRNSVGFDINPLGILAGNVKTRSRRFDEFGRKWQRFNMKVHAALQEGLFADNSMDYKQYVPQRHDLSKWFLKATVRDLAKLRALIERVTDQEFKEFLTLAFAAIIRRVSNAYDGEVRPHVNPNKRPRRVFEAFTDKVSDMLSRLERLERDLPDKTISSRAIQWDSRAVYQDIAESVDLIVAHPPYLNCFNYIPVYRWEMIWLGIEPSEYAAKEVISWPAKPDLVERYYADNRKVIQAGKAMLRPGGRYCIVIGDCTIGGRLEKTHVRFIEMCKDSGLDLERVIYRDTYYATGRYAYNHRAEYNYDEEAEDKRDMIIVCVKP